MKTEINCFALSNLYSEVLLNVLTITITSTTIAKEIFLSFSLLLDKFVGSKPQDHFIVLTVCDRLNINYTLRMKRTLTLVISSLLTVVLCLDKIQI